MIAGEGPMQESRFPESKHPARSSCRGSIRHVGRRADGKRGTRGGRPALHLGIDGPVVVCCGRGNNGGDGFVVARHLDLRGYAVRVLLLAEPGELQGDAAVNFHVLQRANVPIHRPAVADLDFELADAAWTIDCLLGTGNRGEPRPPLDAAIERINAGHSMLAVDVPSGLDCDTGQPAQAYIHTWRA